MCHGAKNSLPILVKDMLKRIAVREKIPQKHSRKIMKWITAHVHEPIRIRYCTYTQGSEILIQLSNG